MFKCDADRNMSFLQGRYTYYLNSDDAFDPSLPLKSQKAWGGTMALWKLDLDPCITVHPPPSSAILPIIIQAPQYVTTLHVCVYLPTSGKDSLFIKELSNLTTLLYDLSHLYPSAPIYLRGDFNVNEKNRQRKELLQFLIASFNLMEVPFQHKTYHHFVGEGQSDSKLDRIFYSDPMQPECLDSILCGQSNSSVASSHDALLSSWSSRRSSIDHLNEPVILAPKADIPRQ